MDVTAAKDDFNLPPMFQRGLGSLIESVGKCDFAANLFRVIRGMTGCEQLITFTYRRGSAPRTLLNAHTDMVSNFPHRNKRYMEHFWRHDPVHRLDEMSKPSSSYLVRIDVREIASRNYREECFTDINLGSRMSLVGNMADQIMRLNIYMRDREAFESSVVGRMNAAFPVLDSLLRRHASECDHTPHRLDADDIRQRLRIVAPSLTPRELEVCTHIARGLTSEGIALELGISRNTVLTFRKRAYARLHIATQNELMHMMM